MPPPTKAVGCQHSSLAKSSCRSTAQTFVPAKLLHLNKLAGCVQSVLAALPKYLTSAKEDPAFQPGSSAEPGDDVPGPLFPESPLQCKLCHTVQACPCHTHSTGRALLHSQLLQEGGSFPCIFSLIHPQVPSASPRLHSYFPSISCL